MTTYNKSTLKTFFQTGDVPDGTDYGNLIDSCLNLIETGEQDMAGALYTTQLITPLVSGANANFTGTVSATSLHVTGNVSGNSLWTLGNLTVSGDIISRGISITADISANRGYFNAHLSVSGHVVVNGPVSANSLNVTGDISAATGTVYASAIRMQGGGIYRAVSIVSAAGTTQATGAALGLNGVIRLKGIADGSTTGFVILANQTGLQQTVYVEENTSCNLWPCVGGQINALASNAAFAMAGNTTYIVTHIKASGYSVK